ncbi:MAG: DUF3943 domain-containing protein [Fibromonadales bacterium]|nr:DUF3943 domain-containing protein [Fibromonadales bacterium]
MKRILLLIAFLGTFAVAQTSDAAELDSAYYEAPKPALHWTFPLLMGFTQNVIVWQYNLQIKNESWARISPRTIKANFKNGFEWDNNHFGINFFGHPYQGSYYFTSARSFGYSFYPSLLYATIGSFTWECCMESEMPSTNDLILTSLGGAIYGEILYRLSERLLAKPKPSLLDEASAFAFHPMSYSQRKFAGVRQNNPRYHPIDFSIGLGGGYRFGGNYNYDREFYEQPNIDSWSGKVAMIDLSLVYGKPNRTMKEPLEYFTIDASYHYGRDGRRHYDPFFRMHTLGKLKNMNFSLGNSWVDVGTYTHFDTYYGDLVEMNAVALGLGLDFNLQGSSLRFRTTHLPSFVVLGATDFRYDEIFADEHEIGKRGYNYNYGFHYKFNTEIEWLGRGIFRNNTGAYMFRTMPSSEPHYGTNGLDIILNNSAILEVYLPWKFKIGTRFDSYLKVATYDNKDFSLMSRMIFSHTAYLAYSF